MADDIPEWAFKRLIELADDEPLIDGDKPHVAQQRAFARYITEHEEPPVDPLLLEAREIVKACLDPQSHTKCNCRADIDAGEWDNGKVKTALAALKRGMELAREQADG